MSGCVAERKQRGMGYARTQERRHTGPWLPQSVAFSRSSSLSSKSQLRPSMESALDQSGRRVNRMAKKRKQIVTYAGGALGDTDSEDESEPLSWYDTIIKSILWIIEVQSNSNINLFTAEVFDVRSRTAITLIYVLTVTFFLFYL